MDTITGESMKRTWLRWMPNIIAIPGSWFMFFLLVLCSLIFIVYKSIVWLVLKARHGDKFYGFFNGGDTVMMFDEAPTNRVLIYYLFYIEIKDDKTITEFNQFARTRISATFSQPNLEKLRLLRRQFAGYYYYERINFNCDDCIHALNYDGDLADLNVKLNDLANSPMPYNDRGSWDVYIGQSAMKENGCVPIFFRFHHCACDGLSLGELFTREVSTTKQSDKSSQKVTDSYSHWDVDPNKYYDPFLHHFPMTVGRESNYYFCKTLSGKKILTWFSDNSSHYMNKIKSIKNRYKNVSFVDVVLTAYSTALMQLAKQASKNTPLAKEMTLLATVKKGVTFEYGQAPNYALDNKIAVFFIKLPLESITKDVEQNLYVEMEERLKIINEQHNIIKHNSVDVDFNYFITEVYLNIWPTFPMRYIYSLNRPTVVISNLPGCKLLHFYGDDLIKEYVMFTPNIPKTATGLMICTYDGRFNCSFTLDSVKYNQAEAEKLRKLFLECLDRFSKT